MNSTVECILTHTYTHAGHKVVILLLLKPVYSEIAQNLKCDICHGNGNDIIYNYYNIYIHTV